MRKIKALFKDKELAINVLYEHTLSLNNDNNFINTLDINCNSVFGKIRCGLCEAIAYEREMKSTTKYKLNIHSEDVINKQQSKLISHNKL